MSNYATYDVEQLAEIFKALSNPNRLQIFLRLLSCCQPGVTYASTEDEVCPCVGDLGKELNIVPSTVSHHIKELNRVGLIRLKRQGKNVECSIDSEALDRLAMFFNERTSD